MRTKDINSLNSKRARLLSEIEDLKRALALIPSSSVLGYLGITAAIKMKEKEISKIESEIWAMNADVKT